MQEDNNIQLSVEPVNIRFNLSTQVLTIDGLNISAPLLKEIAQHVNTVGEIVQVSVCINNEGVVDLLDMTPEVQETVNA